LWKWIDAHEKELGIGRPYLDKDPPHVAPIDGKEYADKRSAATARLAGLKKPSPSSKTKVNPSRERRMSAVIRRGIMRFIRSLPLAALAVCEIKLAVNVDGRQGLPTAT